MKLCTFLFAALAALALVGCGEKSAPPTKADALAVSDPDAKARQLLAEFDQAEDQKTWIQNNNFALSVFQTVKDPKLKAEYDQKIAPLLGTK